MHPQFHPTDPLRRPNWRYYRARELAYGGPRPRRGGLGEDLYVLDFRKFLVVMRRALQTARGRGAAVGAAAATAPAADDFFSQYAARLAALRLHRDDASDSATIVEARILARQTDAQIAAAWEPKRPGLTAAAVEWYAQMFFDVRDRLAARDYIERVAINHPASPAVSPAEAARRRRLRATGYYGGPRALDAALASLAPADQPQRAEHVAAWRLQQLLGLVDRQALAQAAAGDLSPADLARLRSTAAAAQQTAASQSLHPIEQMMKEALDCVPYKLLRRAAPDMTELERFFYSSPVEPSADELQAIHQGRVPTQLLERLLAYRPPHEPFPDADATSLTDTPNP